MSEIIDNENKVELAYEQVSGKIFLRTYSEGFFNCEIDMTNAVLELAIEKLFNDMDCEPNGGKITLTRKKDVRGDLVRTVGEIVK